LEWQVGGFAADPPTAFPAVSTAQLVRATASFGASTPVTSAPGATPMQLFRRSCVAMQKIIILGEHETVCVGSGKSERFRVPTALNAFAAGDGLRCQIQVCLIAAIGCCLARY
jgi:hypothetical protein